MKNSYVPRKREEAHYILISRCVRRQRMRRLKSLAVLCLSAFARVCTSVCLELLGFVRVSALSNTVFPSGA
ncbi:hypothetical protein LZ31DRAFT_151141 [Colletotrichum somersetense]|nr:hypothetical protein LZ31DRAFT_151141 [Colletotrichum somersetense]